MKILLLSPWFPSPPFGGALIRVFETVRHLAQRHRVTLLAPVHGQPSTLHLRAITDLGVEVITVPVSPSGPAAALRLARGLLRGQPLLQGLHYHPSMAREVRRLTALYAYDIVHVEHSFMTPYLAWRSRSCRARTVLSMHNIESLRFRRELHFAGRNLRRAVLALDTSLFGSWEEPAVREFDAVAAVSAVEQGWVRQQAPAARLGLVPNGVNVEHFRPVAHCTKTRNLVFCGLMNYPPNVDAVVWFCDAILPLVARRYPDVRFSIVGDKPTRVVSRLAARSGVEVTGQVADVRPYLAKAAVAAVPVRSGAGTRLKILEAMAMHRPVVATRLGAEGLQVTPGVNILIGDSPGEFADHICTLLADPRLADQLGREGRRLVEGRYDWRACFRSLDELYEAVAGRQLQHERPTRVAVMP